MNLGEAGAREGVKHGQYYNGRKITTVIQKGRASCKINDFLSQVDEEPQHLK